jgi:outer membrane protein assembly factor BamE
MRNHLIIPLILTGFLVTACGSTVPMVKPFKMDIQQGNVVTSKMLLQLRPGMTKSQVKFIMGTPLIIDSFHSNRWDYFYQMRHAGKITEQRRVILDFDKDLLTKVRGDVVPQGTAGAEPAQDGNTLAAAKSVAPNPKKEEGVLDKLKFWKSDEKEVVNSAVKPETAKPKEEKSLMDKLKFWKKDETPAVKDAPVVAAPAAAEAVSSETSAESTPSLLAVPITGVPAIEAPNVDAPVQDVPKVEAPIVAVPVQDMPSVQVPSVKAPATPEVSAPVVEIPKSEPATVEPMIVAPIVEPVVIAPQAEPMPAPAPTAATGKDEPFIFRMDKKLNLKNLEASSISDAEAKVNAKKVDTPPPLPEEVPGYFERMLEKIGF